MHTIKPKFTREITVNQTNISNISDIDNNNMAVLSRMNSYLRNSSATKINLKKSLFIDKPRCLTSADVYLCFCQKPPGYTDYSHKSTIYISVHQWYSQRCFYSRFELELNAPQTQVIKTTNRWFLISHLTNQYIM